MATQSITTEIAQGIVFEISMLWSRLKVECKINDKRFLPRYASVSGQNILLFVDIVNFAIEMSKKYRQRIELKANISLAVCVDYKSDECTTLILKTTDTAYKGDYCYDDGPEYTFTHEVASNMTEIQKFLKSIEDVYSKKDEQRKGIGV